MQSIIYERRNLGDSTHDGKPVVNSKRFAFMLYIALTIMLFAGLFGGWFVLRGNNDIWPPTGTPAMTVLNTLPESLTMIASVILLVLAMGELRKADIGKFQTYLLISGTLCILFVSAMGMEYWRLIAGGVTMSTVFGGLYFTITTIYLLHFLGGTYALFRLAGKARLFPAATGISAGFANTLNFHYLMLALWGCIVYLVYIN